MLRFLGIWYRSIYPFVEGILPKGPTRHADVWQIGPFWQDTLDVSGLVPGIRDQGKLMIAPVSLNWTDEE